jgi:putative ABC transport system permease protein
VHLQTFDLGFDPARVLVGQVNPARTAYQTPESVTALYDRLLERAAALPGVEIAALSSVLPLGGDSDMDITIEGRPAPATPGEATTIWYRIVSHDYFRAMGIRITRGRGFERGEAAPVVVVSEAAARRYWGDADPVGRRVKFGDPTRPWSTIVGVVNEVHMRGARGESVAEAYLPYWQRPELGTNVVLKTAGDPASAIAPLRQAALEVDGNLPVARVAPMTAIVARSIEQPRFVTLLVGLFAGLALSLAAVGIYGLIAFSVARRTPEIGVRIALGASRCEVLMLVVREGVVLTVAGVAIGVVLAAVAGSGMKTLLFGVEPVDPLTFAAVGACLLATAVAASLLPALRAARVDPMVALRSE